MEIVPFLALTYRERTRGPPVKRKQSYRFFGGYGYVSQEKNKSTLLHALYPARPARGSGLIFKGRPVMYGVTAALYFPLNIWGIYCCS